MIYKDPELALRKGYYNAINYSVSWDGLPVKPYSKVPNNLDTYIRFLDQTSNSLSSTKTSFNTDCTITLDIVTRFHPAAGSFDVADIIANQIFAAVLDKENPLILDLPFYIITSNLEFSQRLTEEESDTDIIYRRILRFQHLIAQSDQEAPENINNLSAFSMSIPFIVAS